MAKPGKRVGNIIVDGVVLDQHIGARLKLLRTMRVITQTTLGAEIGVSFQQIQKMESGANRVSAAVLYRLSQVLDVPVSFFYDDIGVPVSGDAIRDSVGLSDSSLLRAIQALPEDARVHVVGLVKGLAKTAGEPTNASAVGVFKVNS